MQFMEVEAQAQGGVIFRNCEKNRWAGVVGINPLPPACVLVLIPQLQS
jgi:hypothetical protein